MNDPLRVTSTTAPIDFWLAVTNPDNTAWEHHIRRDQKRLDARELRSLSGDLRVLLARLERIPKDSGSVPVRCDDLAALIRIGTRLAAASNIASEAIGAA